ncbi:hypothetical protein [Burkholderia cepacia]|uniref:hypothetical protein n=1 Tax=Burkholderia cepacia TaxID=292 RepID=UPI002AB7151F|nr:hypothetical protein [Burkholderia cepacia]
MDFMKLALVIGILAIAAKGIQLFSRRCQRRFGFSFFTTRGFWLAAIAINFLWWGYFFQTTAPLRHIPLTGGLILLAMGLASTAWLIFENVRDTDLLHGIGGSALQLTLFFPVALYGIPLLVITLLFATYKGAPAWLIDR